MCRDEGGNARSHLCREERTVLDHDALVLDVDHAPFPDLGPGTSVGDAQLKPEGSGQRMEMQEVFDDPRNRLALSEHVHDVDPDIGRDVA